MTKYITITTFPNKAWLEYLNFSTMSYMQNFPKEVDLLIKIFKNEHTEVVNQSLQNLVSTLGQDAPSLYVENGSTKEEMDFYERHKNYVNKGDYRTNYIDFSHKIFALYQSYLCAKEVKADYIIWLDSDIITKEKISIKDIENWTNDADIAYLGRKDWDHSECGFVAYKVETAGKFIERFHEMYVNDEVLKLEQYHDSYVFDKVREQFPTLKYHNISENINGRDVFNESVLGQKLIHFKGPAGKKSFIDNIKMMRDGKGPVTKVDDIIIKTKNCVDKDKIRDHISKNVRRIQHWYKPCKETDEKIVICSAGPSLDPIEVRKLYDKGYKVVAVKHAIKALQAAGITPWAVILLDPRAHVEGFIDDIHPETWVFVASMCDPVVVERLIEKNYRIIGYHAAVGANETDFCRNGDALIVGGSATSTRGISLLEGLGFRNMELFGYDCSYHEKPDLKEKKENGTLKYEEITLETENHLGKKIRRTFWTEGQFLAQLQECRDYYFNKTNLNLNFHGNGMIPWLWRNRKYYKEFLERTERENQQRYIPVETFLNRLKDGYTG